MADRKKKGGKYPDSNAFPRSSDRKAPHNAYISGSGITNACSQLGYSLALRPEFYSPKHFNFSAGVNTLAQYGAGAQTANQINLSNVFPTPRPDLPTMRQMDCIIRLSTESA